jgi:RNA polymerase sigma factor (sigma-70 family)
MSAAPKLLRSRAPPGEATQAVPVIPVAFKALEEAGEAPAKSQFTRFFETEWPRLKRYLKRHVGAEEAEDVAQEAFARLYAREAETSSPSGYLYQTARNLVIDGRRRARRAQAVLVESAPMETIADYRPSPEDEVDARQRLAQASVLFDRMTPKCRQVFMLRVVDGCSYVEIARQLAMTPVAVEKQLLRAFEICANWKAVPEGTRRKRTRLS